jgi:predicted PurR-regulated permease PerM
MRLDGARTRSTADAADEPTTSDTGDMSDGGTRDGGARDGGAVSSVRSTVETVRADPLRALAAVVLVLIAVLAVREVAELVVPVIFGLFLALIAAPLVGTLERRGTRHPVALTGAVMVVLVIVLATAAVIAFSIGELIVLIPAYEDRLSGLVDEARDLLAQYGIVADPAALPSIVSPGTLVSFVRPVASAVSDATIAIFVLALTMVYALAGAPSLRARAEAAFGSGHAMFEGVARFGTDLRRYLVVRAQLGLFAAVLVLVLLLVLGVPLPLLWSGLVFAASFIPTVGTLIALVPPTVLALLDGGLVPAALVVVGFGLVNVAQDYLLQPRMMGTELNLSSLVVFLSVIAWAWILGPAGALLAVPLTVALVQLLDAFPSSRGIAALMRHRLDAPPGLVDESEVQVDSGTGSLAGSGSGSDPT